MVIAQQVERYNIGTIVCALPHKLIEYLPMPNTYHKAIGDPTITLFDFVVYIVYGFTFSQFT